MNKFRFLVAAAALCGQSAFAAVKVAPVRVGVGIPAVAAGAASLRAPDLQAIVLPSVQAVAADPHEAVSVQATLEFLGEAAARASVKEGAAGRKIAAAYDGGAAKGDRGSAVAAAEVPEVPRESGLSKAPARAEAEAPAVEKAEVKPSLNGIKETEGSQGSMLGAIAAFLLLLGLVVAEYGGIYYAITHAPRAVPTESEILQQMYGDRLRDFGF